MGNKKKIIDDVHSKYSALLALLSGETISASAKTSNLFSSLPLYPTGGLGNPQSPRLLGGLRPRVPPTLFNSPATSNDFDNPANIKETWMHSGTCARDGKTTYDRETGADKWNELQAVWPAEECRRLNCHAQSYVWFSLLKKKRDRNSHLVENAAVYMEGNQQTQSQGATKQAMIYICGGKKKSKLKSHLFSESRRSFNYLTAQLAGQHVQI